VNGGKKNKLGKEIQTLLFYSFSQFEIQSNNNFICSAKKEKKKADTNFFHLFPYAGGERERERFFFSMLVKSYTQTLHNSKLNSINF